MTEEELIEALIYLFDDCLENDAWDVNDCLTDGGFDFEEVCEMVKQIKQHNKTKFTLGD